MILPTFLETVQKVDKIADIHFFENVAFEKKLACKPFSYHKLRRHDFRITFKFPL